MQYQTGLVLLVIVAVASCGPPKPKTASPAKTEALLHETELLRITLTPDAERRLGLQTVVVGQAEARPTIAAHGEIVILVGNVATSAQADLGALGANRVRADGDVARARAEVQSAQKIAARATALVQEDAGSVRQSDDAQMTLAVARANLQAAIGQRALLGSGDETSNQGRQWVRVAAFASDLDRIEQSAPALVRALGSDGAGISATPVKAAPTANAAAGSVDFYYTIPPGTGVFQVGQRVSVDLPATGSTTGLSIPRTAIVHDAYGGEWVYVQTGPHAYERRRIEVRSTGPDRALLSRGLTRGDRVVVAGTAELFGTEFGSK
jgi:multidrug efflux system membrane fusion protein